MPAAREPKVVMTLLVRNEEEVLVANLAHHLAHGVDLVIAMDHRSEDATPRILEEHAATGRVVVLRQDADEYRQFEWVTEMARMACVEHGADWVINGDADEFYLARRGSLKDALAAIPERYGILDVPVVDFLPRPDDAGFFADRMVARETVSFKPGTGDVLKNVVHRATPDVVVAGGNHNLVDS